MEANDVPCIHRPGHINTTGQKSIYSCNGGSPYRVCTLTDQGVKVNGVSVWTCDTCEKRNADLTQIQTWTPPNAVQTFIPPQQTFDPGHPLFNQKLGPIELPTPPLAIQPPKPEDIAKSFDRVVIINLDRRQDRRDQIKKEIAELDPPWPFVQPEFMKAIDGQIVDAPEGFGEGRNVWACLQSHRHAIENALNDGVQSVLILEDDATFVKDFAVRAIRFMSDIPDDWEFAMFGGHFWNTSPIAVKDGIVRPQHWDRMHAYAARGTGILELYRHWHQWHSGHCDHAVSKWITTRKTYCVMPWIVGQKGGISDIMRDGSIGQGALKPEEWWHIPPAAVITATTPTVTVGNAVYATDPVQFQHSFVLQGVGSEVSKILKSIDIHPEQCGGCIEMILKMNAWGVAGCEENREEILTRLRAKMAELPWHEKLKKGINAVLNGLAAQVDWLDPAPSILDLALNEIRKREYRPLLTAVMATRGRAAQAKTAVEAFYETTRGHDVEMVVGSHNDDTPAILYPLTQDREKYPGLKVVLTPDADNAIQAWNQAAAHARGKWLKVYDDDIIAQPGWLDQVVKTWENSGKPERFYCGLWDDDSRVLSDPPTSFTRALGSRSFFVDVLGGVLCVPSFQSWYDDTEKFDRAIATNTPLLRCLEAKFIHHQANRGKAPQDETSMRARMKHASDAEMYRRRKAQGFPNNYLPVIQK